MFRELFISAVLAVYSTASLAAYHTVEQAAIAAEKVARNSFNGEYWEYGGVIVLRYGQITFSPPTTDHSEDSVTIDIHKLMQPGDVLLGLYHQHPCADTTHFPHWYSTPDLYQAYYYGVPSFIDDECYGTVHEFDPHVDNPHANGVNKIALDAHCKPMMVHLTSGRIIGSIHQMSPNIDKPGLNLLPKNDRCDE